MISSNKTTMYKNETMMNNNETAVYNNETAVYNNETALYSNETTVGSIFKSKVLQPYISAVAFTGFLGNILIILVMLRKESRQKAIARLLLSLATCNNACLLSFTSGYIIYQTKVGEYVGNSLASCKVFIWFRLTFSLMSNWLIVFISVALFVTVCCPLRVHHVNTVRNTQIAIAVIFCIGGTINLVQVLPWRRLNGECLFDNIDDNNADMDGRSLVVSIIYGFVFLMLPVPLLIVLNFINVFVFCRKPHEEIKHRNQTIMLLVTMIVFILLVLPLVLAYSIHVPASKKVKEVTQLLLTVNYSIQFFIYVVVGRQFRMNLCSVFKSILPVLGRWSSRVGTITDSSNAGPVDESNDAQGQVDSVNVAQGGMILSNVD